MASTASTVDIEDGPIPMKEMYIEIQQNPCTTDTISTNNFVSYSKASPTQGIPVYMSGIGIYIGTKCPHAQGVQVGPLDK